MSESEEQEYYMFKGETRFHLTESMDDPVSICGKAEAKKRIDGSADRGSTYPFKGFDAKPEHKWCKFCHRLFHGKPFHNNREW